MATTGAALHGVDSILYLVSLLRDHPRGIDRYIDYFGGAGSESRRGVAARSAPWNRKISAGRRHGARAR